MDEGKERFVYFRLGRGKSAKKHFFSQYKLSGRQIDMGGGQELLLYTIPEFHIGRRTWDEEGLCGILREELEKAGASDYYLEPALGKRLGLKEKLPPELLVQKVLQQNPCWEYLFFVGFGEKENEEEEEGAFLKEIQARELQELIGGMIAGYLPRINHLTVVTDKPALYEDFAEYIYQEYGIPAAFVSRLEKCAGKKKKTVIIDARRSYRPPCHTLPEEAAYIDLWSENEKRYLFEVKRRDIRYLSVVKFLDTL